MTTTANTSIATIEARKKPIDVTGAQYARLEAEMARCFIVAPGYRYERVAVKDAEGKVISWKDERVEDGLTFRQVSRPDLNTLQALVRPVAPGYVIAHLTRLEAHLKHTRGKEAFDVICDDIDRDLQGVSEWAVVKACEAFRCGDKPWFPDTPTFIAEVRKWDELARRIAAPPPKQEPAFRRVAAPDPAPEKTPEMKARVAALVHHGVPGAHANPKEFAENCAACAEVLKRREEEALA
jgi:hypothetical protein